MAKKSRGKHQPNVKKGTVVQKRLRFKISNSIESFLDRCIIGWHKRALMIELGSLAKQTEHNKMLFLSVQSKYKLHMFASRMERV